MSWRRIVHNLTGRCMGRAVSLGKAEVRIEVISACNGEDICRVELYKFGELVDEHAGSSQENFARVQDWLTNHAP